MKAPAWTFMCACPAASPTEIREAEYYAGSEMAQDAKMEVIMFQHDHWRGHDCNVSRSGQAVTLGC